MENLEVTGRETVLYKRITNDFIPSSLIRLSCNFRHCKLKTIIVPWFNADRRLTGRKIVKYFNCIDENIVKCGCVPFSFRDGIPLVPRVLYRLCLFGLPFCLNYSSQIPQSVDCKQSQRRDYENEQKHER